MTMVEKSTAGSDGFALLETVVAFAILALAMTVGVQAISQSVRTYVSSTDLWTANQIRDQLAIATIPALHEAGVRTGTSGIALWQIESAPVGDEHARALFAVTLIIRPRGDAGPTLVYHSFASGEPL